MPSAIAIPLQVYIIGGVISFGIAFLIKFMLDAIRFFTKESKK